MRTLLNRSIFPASIVFLFLTSLAAVADQAPSSQPLTEEQKLEQVKSYFQSEYQEEDYFRTDRLLVSATGSLKPVHIAPSVASVITSADIEAMGATTLNEVLETVPGLHVSPSGPNIFSSIWSIRGIYTSNNPEVLLLINGISVNGAASGGRQKTVNMPVAMISRVEIIRGPGSALHGADAFAGTVNVITKDGHEVDGTKIGFRYGSFETYDGWFQHGGDYGDWNLIASIEARKTESDHDRIVEQDFLGSGPPSVTPFYLDTRARQIDLFLGANRKDRWIANIYGAWFGDNGGGPGGLQALTEEESSVDGRQILVDLSYNNNDLRDDLDFSIRLFYHYQKIDIYNQLQPSSLPGNMIGEPIVTENNSGIEASGIYEGFAQHQLRMATGVKYFNTETDEIKNFIFNPALTYIPLQSVKGTPYIFMDNQDRFLWYISFQDEWSFARKWQLTAGIRYDHYSDFGGTINPRLALVWESRYNLIAKLLYGKGFRAPSFSEQNYQANPVFAGNKDLDPETIDTYEVAFDWQPIGNLRIIPSLFYYEFKDAIEFIGGPPPKAENYGKLEGKGFELEARWQLTETLELNTNLAYQNSRNKDIDEIVPDTPAWQSYVEANWEFLPEWFLNCQYFWIADRHRADGDPRSKIDDYNLVNITLRRKNIANHFDFALSVRNLFDEDAREPSPYDPLAPAGAYIPNDYPMETRAIFGEIRFHF